MYQNTQKNIPFWNIKLKLYVVVQKNKKLKIKNSPTTSRPNQLGVARGRFMTKKKLNFIKYIKKIKKPYKCKKNSKLICKNEKFK